MEMIGATPAVIKKAEDRELFRDAMTKIGLRVPRSAIVRTLEEALAAAPEIGYPIIVRPSFTLGGTGGRHRLQPGGLPGPFRHRVWRPA